MPADNPVTTLRTDKGQGIENHQDEINAYANLVNGELNRTANAALGWANIANGATPGKLKTTVAVDFAVGGEAFNLVASDDHWDLSAETDTVALKYRAYSLQLDDTGTAGFVSGSDLDSETLAYKSLAAPAAGRSRIGVYIAGPSTDFSLALAAQGTILNGWPLAL